jgi:hypothetical protein
MEDAERRDITINTLFYNVHTRSVEDWTGKVSYPLYNPNSPSSFELTIYLFGRYRAWKIYRTIVSGHRFHHCKPFTTILCVSSDVYDLQVDLDTPSTRSWWSR